MNTLSNVLFNVSHRHLKEHMSDLFDDDDLEDELKMNSEEAMEFHYFKLHDYDGNNKLDGLELGVAMTHFHDETQEGKPRGVPMDDAELSTLIQQILKEDDLNDDGFIDYYEFIHAQQGRSA